MVDTMGGRMHVRWDDSAQATPHGQIAFFAELFVTATAVGTLGQHATSCFCKQRRFGGARYLDPDSGRIKEVRLDRYPWVYGIACELVTGDAPQDRIPPYNLLHHNPTGPYFGLPVK